MNPSAVVAQHLILFLARTFALNRNRISVVDQLRRDLGLNEQEITEAIVHLETTFGVTLPDRVLPPESTVGQLSRLIVRHGALWFTDLPGPNGPKPPERVQRYT